jgi:hypothetical protein
MFYNLITPSKTLIWQESKGRSNLSGFQQCQQLLVNTSKTTIAQNGNHITHLGTLSHSTSHFINVR